MNRRTFTRSAADINIARAWKPGTLKDDGKRGGTEQGSGSSAATC